MSALANSLYVVPKSRGHALEGLELFLDNASLGKESIDVLAHMLPGLKALRSLKLNVRGAGAALDELGSTPETAAKPVRKCPQTPSSFPDASSNDN